MRFLLVFVLCFISVFAVAQVPMAVGGPQGITVTRINAQDWMAVPIMADTPVAPLTGTGWPGRGYIVFVARPDSACAPLPATCPPRDTSLWEYTGQRWKRVGMDYLTRLVFGGQVTQNQTSKKNFAITAYSAFINGSFYRRVSTTLLTSVAKTADSTSRLDVIVIGKDGPLIKTGVPNVRPNKPVVNGDEIELTTIFFPANDTVPSATSSTNFVSSIFRIAGRDSIYYTQNNQTYAIKDSIGISTSTNGLTYSDKNVKLGGSLIENTTISLPSRRLSIASSSDTTRFFANGSVSIGGAASDSTYKLNVNGTANVSSTFTGASGRGKLWAISGDAVYVGEGSSGSRLTMLSSGLAGSDIRLQLNNSTYGRMFVPSTESFSIDAFKNTAFLIGGVERARISPTGNFLINRTVDSIYKLDVNGRARISDTLTLSTTPVTADTSANDLLVINSSNGQVRRFTGAFPGSIPTLQQVTTVGNSTTDSINVKDGTKNLSVLTKEFTGSSYYSGTLLLNSNSNNDYIKFNYDRIVNSVSGDNNIIYWPDSSGNLSQRVKANGVTYSAGLNGVVDIGDYWLSGSATLDFGNTTAQNSADLTITVTGAAIGDVVSLGVSNGSVNANTCFTAWVSATDTVTVRFNNYSSGAVDPASGTFKIKVLK